MIGPDRISAGRRATRALLVLLLALLGAACQSPPPDNAGRLTRIKALYASYKADFPTAPEITPQAALDLARQDKLLPIDTRSAKEQAVSMLPGAVTAQAYLAHPDDYGNRVPVAYCTIGYRSGIFAANAAKQGRTVANLAEGLLGWLHAGGSLVDASGRPTKRVHVYGRTWNLAPLGYTAVW